MNEEKQEEQQQEVNEDVAKAFGNEEKAEEAASEKKDDPKSSAQVESEQKQEGSQSAAKKEKQSNKTYTQAEVDAMMAKARKKYTNSADANEENAITDESGVAESTDASNEVTQDLATGLTIDRLAQAELKASMAIGGINPSKVQRAVRLIDISNVIVNGVYSEEKAKAEIETLLQEWPELKAQASDSSNGNGFYFGAPEQEEPSQEDKQKGMFSSIFGNK